MPRILQSQFGAVQSHSCNFMGRGGRAAQLHGDAARLLLSVPCRAALKLMPFACFTMLYQYCAA
jgi:hypothetical protein